MYRFSFFILFITIISLEILLRLFYPFYQSGNISNYRYDVDLGIKLKENLNDIKITDHRQEVITNQYGTLNYESNFSKYDKLIYAIGDSNTQGSGVPFDSSYPFIMYTDLNSVDENSWGVINVAVAAYGTKQAILMYDATVKKLKKPKYVTYLADKNDYMGDFYFEKGNKHKHLVDRSPRFFGFAKYIGLISNEVEVLKRLKYLLHKKDINKNYHQKEDNFKEVFIDNYSKKILKLNNRLNKENITLIFSWQALGKNKEKICEDEYGTVKEWANENNIVFADWCPSFLKIRELNENIPVINDHSASHARSWVNRIISKSFQEEILKID